MVARTGDGSADRRSRTAALPLDGPDRRLQWSEDPCQSLVGTGWHWLASFGPISRQGQAHDVSHGTDLLRALKKATSAARRGVTQHRPRMVPRAQPTTR